MKPDHKRCLCSSDGKAKSIPYSYSGSCPIHGTGKAQECDCGANTVHQWGCAKYKKPHGQSDTVRCIPNKRGGFDHYARPGEDRCVCGEMERVTKHGDKNRSELEKEVESLILGTGKYYGLSNYKRGDYIEPIVSLVKSRELQAAKDMKGKIIQILSNE